MLENQRKFLEYTEKVENIISPISLMTGKEKGQDYSQLEKLKNIQKELQNKELIIPIVGGFSAGKSSLINSFLGKDILPIALTPETALPAELRYSSTDYIEAIDKGKKDRYSLSDFELIKEKTKKGYYQYLKIYLNNQNLKNIEPLVLVDMPGFSSPVVGHNDVIIDYRSKGVYFIFLTAATEGTLQNDIISELNILNEIGKGFSFCLSKTNLKPHSQVIEIKENITEELNDLIDNFDGNITLLDDNGGENLNRIIQSIDPNKLIYRLFIEQLQDNFDENKSLIERTIKNLDQDSKDLENAIQDIEQGFKKIEEQKDNAIKSIRSKDTDYIIEIIINEIKNEIISNASYLASIALNDKHKFENEFNSIIRNRLQAELKKHLEKIAKKNIDDLQTEISSLNFLNEIDPELINEIVEKIQKDIQDSSKSLDLSETLSILSTLAGLISGVIGTILKKVIDILKYIPILDKIFGSSNNEEYQQAAKEIAKDKIKNTIIDEIMPRIISDLRNKIPDTINNALEKMVETITKEFEQQLKTAQRSQKQALLTKQENKQNIEQEKLKLNETLVNLTNLQKELY